MVDTVQLSPINLGRMGPIGVIPPGFMNLLALKQLGQLPGTLSSVVAGVIELRDWYLTAVRIGTQALFGAIPNVNGGITTTGIKQFTTSAGATKAQVPAGQIWWVEQLTVQTSLSVGTDHLAFTPIIEDNTGSTFYAVGPMVPDQEGALGPAGARTAIGAADRGFWAFPGDIFAVFVNDQQNTGVMTAILNVRASALQI